MSKELIIFGEASQSIVRTITPKKNEEHLSLMDFLRKYDLPIASSCLGEGHCRKCQINGEILSCQISVNSFITQCKDLKIIVSYL